MKKTKAFTLVELLIASAIFSIVILSIYSAFQTGILSYARIDSAFNIYQTARIVLNKIEIDLKNSFSYSKDESRFKGDGASLDFLTLLDTFEKGEPQLNICRIEYKLDNNVLKRTGYQGLDAIKPELSLEGEELNPDVKKLTLMYAYPIGDPVKPYDWQDSWPSTSNDPKIVEQQAKTLPLAVKIELSLIERDKKQKEIGSIEFTKIVPLPLGEALSSVSSASSGGKTGG